jgi:hypothetical protein
MGRAMNGAERRATVRLQRYWESMRRLDGVPWFSDFKPARNPVAWDRCILVTLAGAGTPVVEHVGASFREQLVSELADLVLDQAWRLQDAAAPASDEGEMELRERRAVRFRSLWLPFRNALDEVRFGLAAVTWQEHRAETQPVLRPQLRLVAGTALAQGSARAPSSRTMEAWPLPSQTSSS